MVFVPSAVLVTYRRFDLILRRGWSRIGMTWSQSAVRETPNIGNLEDQSGDGSYTSIGNPISAFQGRVERGRLSEPRGGHSLTEHRDNCAGRPLEGHPARRTYSLCRLWCPSNPGRYAPPLHRNQFLCNTSPSSRGKFAIGKSPPWTTWGFTFLQLPALRLRQGLELHSRRADGVAEPRDQGLSPSTLENSDQRAWKPPSHRNTH